MFCFCCMLYLHIHFDHFDFDHFDHRADTVPPKLARVVMICVNFFEVY